MDTQTLELNCPICGMGMEYKHTDTYMIGEAYITGSDNYTCDNGHEKIEVIAYENKGGLFVFLGVGCYLVDSRDNTSCEKAIARMRQEYEWNTGFTNGV